MKFATLFTSISHIFSFRKIHPLIQKSCIPATLEAEFKNGVDSIPVRGNSSSVGGWIV